MKQRIYFVLIILAALALCLLPAICFGQTVGQIGVQKWTAGGTRTTWITPVNSRAIGVDSSGNLSMVTTGGGAGLDNIASSVTGGTLTFVGTLTTGRLITWRDVAGTVALTSDLSGYASLSGSYANPSWISSLAWSKLSSTPTTLTGYGITDALTSATAASTYAPLDSPTFTGTVTIPAGAVIPGYLTVSAAGSNYQPLDADLIDLADGTLTGSKVGTGINATNITTGTVADARLGSNVSLLGSSIALGSEVTGTLPIANGGTGQTTTSGARLALLPAITGNGGKFLRVNAGASDYELASISGGGDALTSGTLGQFAATTSAQLRGVLSDESGTGVFLTANGSAADLTDFPILNQDTTGNAATATALQTAPTINGTAFDGTASISVTVDASAGITGTTLNPTVTISSLEQLGAVASGVWHATPIADAYISSAATWNSNVKEITRISNLTSNGFVKTVSGTGQLSIDTATYLTTTGNGSSLTGITQSQVSGLTTTDRPQLANVRVTHSTLTYGATTNLDMDADGFQTVSLTGNITFTSSNRAAGRSKTLRIIADGSSRTLTFPAGWTFLGAAAPTSVAASKTAVLTVTFFGTADSDAVAAYAVQP